MVEIQHNGMIDIPSLNWPADLKEATYSYDKSRDVLFVRHGEKRPAVSLDVGGHFWVRFEPETGDVIGIEIEDFEQVFLAKYPEARMAWQEIKPKITKRFRRQNNSISEYLRFLLLFVQKLMNDHPHQRGFAPN
jgi:hypothetical protein